MMNKISIVLLFLVLAISIQAQVNVKDSLVNAPMVNVHYSLQVPGADMAARFGLNSNVGVSYLNKSKSNFIYGASFDFIFGSDILEDSILNIISTSGGNIISKGGGLAIINQYERGWGAYIHGGKVIPFLSPNKNSGFVFLAGVGLLQHKIRYEDKQGIVPQLRDDYKKGYDRLTNGLAFKEYLGYQYLSNNRMVNFFVGFEMTQAITKNRRSYNFDLMREDNSTRLDLLNGFKLGWTLPLYKKVPNDFYYY